MKWLAALMLLASVFRGNGGANELRRPVHEVQEAVHAGAAGEFADGRGPLRDLVLRRAAGSREGRVDADALFAQGYLDGAGPPHYLRHLVEDVLPCEGGDSWEHADAYHVSRAQFAWGSWKTAALHTGHADPLDPYHVGRNVAWLINELERGRISPGSTGGWPHCWWVGRVP